MAADREIDRMIVRLIGDASSYKAMMREAQRITREAQKVIGEIGSTMTRSVTLPLVAIGTAAVKTFTDFQHALAKIQGLAGASAERVAELKEEILKLAPAVGKSPLELAEAMANIEGAGIKGSAGLETLKASAKASAAGMGDTVVVADAVTSALNAYGPANLKASEAVDILVAAVREGKAEASTFAPVLGQVLPTANELGVTFDEAAGMIAFLTKATGSASLAATGLRGILAQLVRPTADAKKALEEAGLSLEDIKASIKEKGLQQTLVELRKTFDSQGVPITRMFADIEGLNAVLQATGPQAKDAAAVIKAVGDSAGATDSAFAAVEKTVKQQFNEAMASLKVVLGSIGEELEKTLVPMLNKATDVLGKLTAGWQSLSPEQKQAIVQFGLVTATIGPLLKALSLLKISLVGTGIGAIAIALGTLTVAFMQNEEAVQAVKDILEPFRGVWEQLKTLWKEMQPLIEGLAAMIANDLKVAFENLTPVIKFAVEILAKYVQSVLDAINVTKNIAEFAAGMMGMGGEEEPGLLSASGASIGGGLAGMIGKQNFQEARKQFDEMKRQREEAAKMEADKESARQKSLGIERELNAMLEEQAEAQKKLMEIEAQRQKSIQDTISALKEEVATYGMSRKELALFQAEQLGASEAQKAVIASLQDELSAKESATKATEDAKRATDEAREAEKRFRDSIRGGGIEGVGRGMEALARIQESRMLRGAGRDRAAMQPKLTNPQPSFNLQSKFSQASAPGGDGVAAQIQILERIALSTEQTAKKEPVEIKSAGIGGN